MMYRVSKRMEIAGAHRLSLDYESKCSNIHGHNWIVTVYCEAEKLNENGMVVDFKKVKEAVSDRLDHKYINDELKLCGEEMNPTAENMAFWIANVVDAILPLESKCYKVTVQESEGNIAEWEDGDRL